MSYGYTGFARCSATAWRFICRSKVVRRTAHIFHRVHSQRSVEMHMVATAARDGGRGDRLSRAQLRDIHGASIPALAPADALVQQCIHLFKHLCGEHTRASWVLELWRHLRTRRDDIGFWQEVERVAAGRAAGRVALMTALSAFARLMFGGGFKNAFTGATRLSGLPHGVRLWVETFGERVSLADRWATSCT